MKTVKNYVIRCGNHWLLTDDICTKVVWIRDRATASRHTHEWARRFAAAELKENRRVEVWTVEEAQALADADRLRRLRDAYFYALESEVTRLAPDIDFHIPGVGCAAYCFAVDSNFAAGITVHAAARVFLKNYKRRMRGNLRKRVSA